MSPPHPLGSISTKISRKKWGNAISVDGVVGRNSGESSSRMERKGEGPTRSVVVAERGIDIRPFERAGRSGNALPGSEPMGAYVTCR